MKFPKKVFVAKENPGEGIDEFLIVNEEFSEFVELEAEPRSVGVYELVELGVVSGITNYERIREV